MKTIKVFTFGMMCLFGFTATALAPNDLLESASEEEAVVYSCSRTYSDCDSLYPNDYDGFDDCMQRGDCGGDTITQE